MTMTVVHLSHREAARSFPFLMTVDDVLIVLPGGRQGEGRKVGQRETLTPFSAQLLRLYLRSEPLDQLSCHEVLKSDA